MSDEPSMSSFFAALQFDSSMRPMPCGKSFGRLFEISRMPVLRPGHAAACTSHAARLYSATVQFEEGFSAHFGQNFFSESLTRLFSPGSHSPACNIALSSNVKEGQTALYMGAN